MLDFLNNLSPKNNLLWLIGPIGAGKSTLVKLLLSVLSIRGYFVVVTLEPVSDPEFQRLLTHSYTDHKDPNAVFAVQQFLLKFYDEQLESVSKMYSKHPETIFIFDRCVFDCFVFTEKYFRDGRLSQDQKTFVDNELIRITKKYEPITASMTPIFINTSIEDCKLNIRSRNRDGENMISHKDLEIFEQLWRSTIDLIKDKVKVLEFFDFGDVTDDPEKYKSTGFFLFHNQVKTLLLDLNLI